MRGRRLVFAPRGGDTPASMSQEPEGWRSTERRCDDGAIASEQRMQVPRPPVERSAGGARRLGRGYWLEVTRASRGLVATTAYGTCCRSTSRRSTTRPALRSSHRRTERSAGYKASKRS
jgi:hypothetical protein